MSTVAPFQNLRVDEVELSKDNIAALLGTYYAFILNLYQHPDMSYFDVFCLTKQIREEDDTGYRDIVRRSSYYSEYDLMIQIAKFYTLNKFFSYHVDSNLDKITPVENTSVPAKYFTNDSRRYNVKDTIKFIRNAFNHNDKDDFQLFRLIQKENDPRIYVEIYLRVPNFHVVISIDELFDIIKPELDIASAYSFRFLDENNNPMVTYQDYLNNKNKKMYYEIIHAYDFNKPVGDNAIMEQAGDTYFRKKIEFTPEQKEAIENQLELLKTNNNAINEILLYRIMRDVIPFGMSKINGYMNDLNYFLVDLYNYEGSFNKFRKGLNRESDLSTPGRMIQTFDNLFYSMNTKGFIDRSFALLVSYVLDSVLNETDTVTINGNTTSKDNLRNSFVHGTYYNYYDIDSSEEKYFLYDYQHKDRRGRTDDNLILENPTIDSYNELSLSNFVFGKVDVEDYPCPLDFVINTDRFDGFKIVFKDGFTRYFINASFDPKTPYLLGIKDVDGYTCYMDDNDFVKISEHLSRIDFSKRNLSGDLVDYLKKIPELSKKATKLFMKLVNDGTLSNNTYFGELVEPLSELEELCKKYKKIPQIIVFGNENDNNIREVFDYKW